MPVRYTAEERYNRAIGLDILVSPEDEWLLSAYTWRISTGGYVSTMWHWGNGYQKDVYIHHMIMSQPLFTTECIDHWDRNKRNNQRPNLMWATYTENKLNSTRSDNAVHAYLKPDGRYQVRIRRDNMAYELGTYDTFEEAQHVRDTWFKLQGDVSASHRARFPS